MRAQRDTEICAYLQVDVQVLVPGEIQGRNACSLEARRRSERLVAWEALLHPGKVRVPRRMDDLRVFPPEPVHLVDVIRVAAIRKRVVG